MGSARRQRVFKRFGRARNAVARLLWSWAERGVILLGFGWLLPRSRTDPPRSLPQNSRQPEGRPKAGASSTCRSLLSEAACRHETIARRLTFCAEIDDEQQGDQLLEIKIPFRVQ